MSAKVATCFLNVAPNAKGEIPQESVDILLCIGEWMSKNGDSIYNCDNAGLPKPEWGRYTRNGNKLYAHILERGIGPIALQGLKAKVKSPSAC